ncbi:MAG: stage V sporulation protein E [candidate division WS6 bacterium 34_10]|uniref:Probable peptidoglycan glycosyltransferase FtsW n=1 Tax=candidate division WS6 bacterium 34_10 TaxID=1641389 RepID=A0A101HFL7_9BACT|nr:MAG: stage V sporulation protein E [candidate division WS6 bacterium 34_10]
MSRKSKPNRKKGSSFLKHKPDKTILYFAILMAIFGAIMIFDASVYKATAEWGDQFYFLKQQVVWIIIGLVPALLIYFWDYRKFLKLSFPLLIITIGLLLAVLLFGKEINGATRWLTIGPIDIQPAEFAKIVLIMYLSSWLAKKDYDYKDLKEAFASGLWNELISFVAILGIIASLIILEPDLGTTIIICATSYIMFLIAGNSKAHTIGSLSVLVLLFLLGVAAAILEPYRLQRVQTYLSLLFTGEVADPRGTGYQMQQILIGIGSGGILGKGFGQSRQRFGYLVENTAFTDSLFAVILEELGLLGGTVIIFSWVFFLWRGLKIATNAPDKQGKLLAAGITIWLVLQALMNMAANVGLIPLTGIPNPFLTYGGSSTIVTLSGIAILLNVSKYTTNGK